MSSRRISLISLFSMLIMALNVLVPGYGVIFAQEPTNVVEVSVTGNQVINTETILNVITLKPGDEYTEQVVERDRAAIMSLGFFSAVTVRKEEVSGGVKISYEVTENPKVTDIKIVGSEPWTPEKVLGLMRTKPGQVLNTTTLNTDIEAIQEAYREAGYFAYVTEDIGVDPKTGVLTVPILVHIVESVEITGNKKTRSYVFLREMKTRPGQIFNNAVLKEDLIRIYNLDILEDIKTPDIREGTEPGLVKITIPVVEKKTGQISLGFGYSSRQRLVGQARLTESNFRGRGQGVNLLWEQGTSDAVGGSSSYEVGFYEPWIDKRHTSLSVSAFNKVIYRFSSGIFNTGETVGDKIYNERRKGADLTLSRPLTEKLRGYIGLRGENVDTDPALINTISGNVQQLAQITQTGDVYSGSFRLVHNTRDIDIDPAAGGYEAISLELGRVDAERFNAIPSGSSYIFDKLPFEGTFRKTSLDFRRYFSRGGRKTSPQDKRTTLAFRFRAGLAGGTIPFFEQFFVGGGESLRGYKEDRFWGNKMMIASLEFRKPIAQSVTGVLFVDYGDAWGSDPINKVNLNGLSQHEGFSGNFGTGIGLRVGTPIGNIRLDYGVGSEGSRTHFSMGHAF